MRHSEKAHCAGKGTASGKESKETSGAVPEGIPPHGSRAADEVRQHRGAVARTRRASAPALQMAGPTGSGRGPRRIAAAELTRIHTAQGGQSAEAAAG